MPLKKCLVLPLWKHDNIRYLKIILRTHPLRWVKDFRSDGGLKHIITLQEVISMPSAVEAYVAFSALCQVFHVFKPAAPPPLSNLVAKSPSRQQSTQHRPFLANAGCNKKILDLIFRSFKVYFCSLTLKRSPIFWSTSIVIRYANKYPDSKNVLQHIHIIFVRHDWILQDTERIFWLPFEYPATYSVIQHCEFGDTFQASLGRPRAPWADIPMSSSGAARGMQGL